MVKGKSVFAYRVRAVQYVTHIQIRLHGLLARELGAIVLSWLIFLAADADAEVLLRQLLEWQPVWD